MSPKGISENLEISGFARQHDVYSPINSPAVGSGRRKHTDMRCIPWGFVMMRSTGSQPIFPVYRCASLPDPREAQA